jgi:Ca2+-binding EF-hand superfamily protein
MTAPTNQGFWGQPIQPQPSNLNFAFNYQQPPQQIAYPQQMFNSQQYQNPMGMNSAFPGAALNLNLNANGTDLNSILGLLGLGGGNTAGLSGIIDIIKQAVGGNLGGILGSGGQTATTENEAEVDAVELLSGNFEEYDENGDGVVSKSEIYAILQDGEDADGDRLSNSTMSALSKMAETRELNFAADGSEAGDETTNVKGMSQADLTALAEHLDEDEDNTVTTFQKDITGNIKDKWDVSKSKAVVKMNNLPMETDAVDFITENFADIDENEDGVLSNSELQEVLSEGEDFDGNALSPELRMALSTFKTNNSKLAKANTTAANSGDTNRKVSQQDLVAIKNLQATNHKTFAEIIKDLG